MGSTLGFFLLLLSYILYIRVLSVFYLLQNNLFFPGFLIALPGATDPQILNGLAMLNHLLSMREQDPEWINWVQRELNERTPDAELAHRIHSFLTIEQSAGKRKALMEAFQCCYYNSGGFPPVEPLILESSVNSLLSRKSIYWDGAALDRLYHSMLMEQGHSPFFREVVEGNADLIQASWEEQQRQEAASVERSRFHDEVHELEQRVRQGRHLREVLRRQIGLRQYQQDISRRQQRPTP